MSTGHVSPPHVTDINAHLTPGAYVEGIGEVKTFELIGLKFSGGTQKRVGAIGNGLDIETQTPILNPMRLLFDSPANVQAAVDAAYYDAIDKNNADGIISTRVRADQTGFTLLHIIGWGTATAKINGREVKITEGQLYRSSQNEPQSEKDSSTSSRILKKIKSSKSTPKKSASSKKKSAPKKRYVEP